MSNRPNATESDVRLAEINSARAKSHDAQVTIRILGMAICCVAGIGLACWAAVEITSKPPWLVLCLTILGPTGIVVVFFTVLQRIIIARMRYMQELEEGTRNRGIEEGR